MRNACAHSLFFSDSPFPASRRCLLRHFSHTPKRPRSGNNYALTSLLEAAAADPGAGLETAALRLAAFTAAAQVTVPGGGPLAVLEGAWMRAFSMSFWDFWGAAADAGWGPWSIESGWTVSWASTGLLLAASNATLWDTVMGAAPGGVDAALLQRWCPVFFSGTDVSCAMT